LWRLRTVEMARRSLPMRLLLKATSSHRIIIRAMIRVTSILRSRLVMGGKSRACLAHLTQMNTSLDCVAFLIFDCLPNTAETEVCLRKHYFEKSTQLNVIVDLYPNFRWAINKVRARQISYLGSQNT
jgi:hypothetical protein